MTTRRLGRTELYPATAVAMTTRRLGRTEPADPLVVASASSFLPSVTAGTVGASVTCVSSFSGAFVTFSSSPSPLVGFLLASSSVLLGSSLLPFAVSLFSFTASPVLFLSWLALSAVSVPLFSSSPLARVIPMRVVENKRQTNKKANLFIIIFNYYI